MGRFFFILTPFLMAFGLFAQTVTLDANGPGATYELLSSVLGGTPYEAPDCAPTPVSGGTSLKNGMRHVKPEFVATEKMEFRLKSGSSLRGKANDGRHIGLAE